MTFAGASQKDSARFRVFTLHKVSKEFIANLRALEEAAARADVLLLDF